MQTHLKTQSRPHNQTMVRAELIPARSDCTEAQTLHFPSALTRDIEKVAKRIGRSSDWCLSAAWRIAESADDELLAYPRDPRMLHGAKQPVRVELPLSTWRHLTAEAEYLDRSKSWLLSRAWLLARARVLAV